MNKWWTNIESIQKFNNMQFCWFNDSDDLMVVMMPSERERERDGKKDKRTY